MLKIIVVNALVQEFYRTSKKKGEPPFNAVFFLTEENYLWEETKKKVPGLSRGWFELCKLPASDRIDFTRDFWLDRLPYQPRVHSRLLEFFHGLDDVAVVCSQAKEGDPWKAEMVYSMQENRSFFRGCPSCKEEEIDELQIAVNANLPHDYLAFLRIHNGFGRLSDLGLLNCDDVIEAKRNLMDRLLRAENPLMLNEQPIDPSALIPFFELFGLDSYQCFFTDWYPENEMGNVYLSGIDDTISDYTDRKEWADHLAFPTFLEWLSFYLEGNSLD